VPEEGADRSGFGEEGDQAHLVPAARGARQRAASCCSWLDRAAFCRSATRNLTQRAPRCRRGSFAFRCSDFPRTASWPLATRHREMDNARRPCTMGDR
jgi:hypothetical protein